VAGPKTYLRRVSLFKVNVVARNPQREEEATPPLEALVDTGSELTWLPADALMKIGIRPRRKRTFFTATRETVTRDVGYAILAADGYETTDEVVFAQPGDMVLLGVRTIAGFGVAVDNIGHRFVAQTTNRCLTPRFAPTTAKVRPVADVRVRNRPVRNANLN
jgi:predicted aspartyl protease